MTGGCSDSCTRAKDVDSGNSLGGRTRERVASSDIRRNILSGHANKGLIKGCSRATDGIQTRPTPALSTVPQIKKARSQTRSSKPDGKFVLGKYNANGNQIGDHLSKHAQYSVMSSELKLSSRNLPVVPKKSVAEIPSIRSGYSSPKKEKSSDPLQGQKIVAKSLPLKSSVNTTARNSGRIGSENHHDKSRETQQRINIRSSNSSALPKKMNQVEKNSHIIGSSRNQTTKVPSQVVGEKLKCTPIASQSKFSSRCVKTLKNEENQRKQLKDNVVIAQDLVHPKDFGSEFPFQYIAQSEFSEDSDDSNVALGINCPLCENDLAYLPPSCEYYDELQPSNLPEVAVLYCGHAFHSRCLEDIIPPHEQCRDPPCYFCLAD